MKVITINVCGIRSSEKKGIFDWLSRSKADHICMQETRALEEQIDNNNLKLENLDNTATNFTTLPLTQDLHCFKSWLNNKPFKSTDIMASLDIIKISNHSLYTGYQVELINILNNNLNISTNQKYFIIIIKITD